MQGQVLKSIPCSTPPRGRVCPIRGHVSFYGDGFVAHLFIIKMTSSCKGGWEREVMNECGIKASNMFPPLSPLSPPMFHPTHRAESAPSKRSRAGLRTAEHYVCTLAEVFAFRKFVQPKLADQSKSKLEGGFVQFPFPKPIFFPLVWSLFPSSLQSMQWQTTG